MPRPDLSVNIIAGLLEEAREYFADAGHQVGDIYLRAYALGRLAVLADQLTSADAEARRDAASRVARLKATPLDADAGEESAG